MESCFFCGGAVERRRITTEFRWGDQLVILEDVPAWVCQVCGEAYFDPETTAAIDGVLANPPPAKRAVTVPVYSLSNVA